ncbi:transglutaminase family protein [Roseicella sp. DB1501]|uniref:transglutaminase family protein n=1 Tax=Roseicella sp. DB1501 TaxID=2730925 RepID=UPI001492EAB1|nr:transglutaminase family protein [Roseicella sp. DB1501]NOG72172.1 transglutaminase family protein [Roseicella sp. DB1501]
MPILKVRHLTTYRYRQPVAFGEHRMMLRPREGHDQRLFETQLNITPAPAELRWLHDVFGNSVAIARFSGRWRELCFESVVRLDHHPLNALDFQIEDYARTYPFAYGMEEMPDLARSIERHYPDPERVVDRWARRFLGRDGPAATLPLLEAMTHAIRRELTYIPRHERGIQDPVKTLKLGSGTCRDFAVLMMEAARSLGLAARFVSGYLYSPGRDGEGHVGGGNTHAWVRVYLPGAGWVEFDPTNGIVGNRDLIRVAIARDPSQALPLHGTWFGFPADSLGMTVEVSVTSETPATAISPAVPPADPPAPSASEAASEPPARPHVLTP